MQVAQVSRQELERRWSLVRSCLADKQIEALVAFCTEDDVGGYVRWLTGNSVIPYRKAVLFDRVDLMTLVEHGALGQHRVTADKDSRHPGVDDIFGVPSFPAVSYTLHFEAEVIAAQVRRRGYRKVAMAGIGNMPHRFVATLNDALAHVQFHDLTEDMDAFVANKSAEEIALIRQAASLQDQIFSAVLRSAQPGMREAEIVALARAEAFCNGAEGGVLAVGSGPQRAFASFHPLAAQNREIEPGDYLSILIENSSPAGYFAELGRTIVFGKADSLLQEAVALATELQSAIRPRFVPGTACAEIFAAHNEDRRRHGLAPEDRIFAHGQGYNMVERPLVRQDEAMTVRAGMNFAIHPTISDGKTVFATMCDNYIVEADGLSACLHSTAKQLFEV